MARLVTSDGAEYETDSDASLMVDEPLLFKEMHPNLPTSGQLVFDVPPAKANGAKLRISDLWGKGDIWFVIRL